MISFGECFTYVLLWSFMVSCLIFKALSHFEFIFVYGVRICSKFIDLHPALQLSQSPLADKTIFSHILLPPLLKINWLKGLGFISGPSILFHWSICLFFANTILFWLLQLCSIVWCLGGLCFLLCCFSSGLLWQFWIFMDPCKL